MSLTTERRLNRNCWTPVPMPPEVNERVCNLARQSHSNRGLTSAWRNGDEILDRLDEIDDDSDDEYVNNENEGDSDDSAYTNVGDDEESESSLPNDDDDHTIMDPLDFPAAQQDDNNDRNDDDENNEYNNAGEHQPENPVIIAAEISENEDNETNESVNLGEITGVDDNSTSNDEDTEMDSDSRSVDKSDNNKQLLLEQEMDRKYGARNHNIGLRPRRERNYDHQHLTQAALKPSDYNKAHANLQHTTLTQFSIKKGLEVFGTAGADAVVKEMEQLDERDVIEPKHARMLTMQEKKTHLSILCS